MSTSAVEELTLQPMEGWPNGFMTRRAFDRLHLVNVHALPETPETVFLRLLGRKRTLYQAMREVATADAADSWTAQVVKHVLVAFHREFAQDPHEEEDMQTMQEIEAAYAEWERKVRQEGAEEGRHGVIKTIELLCRALDIEITDQRRDHLAGQDIEQLVRFADELSRSRRWPRE